MINDFTNHDGYWAIDPILRALYRDLELHSALLGVEEPVIIDADKKTDLDIAERIWLKNSKFWGRRMSRELNKKYPMMHWNFEKEPISVELVSESMYTVVI